jgi:riboflavin transporter FmnP
MFMFRGYFFGGNVMKKTNIKKISVTAMLCALAYICVFVLKFKVSFLTFDFKDAVISIISFLYGPLYGVFSSGVVAFMEFITVSDTGIYGLIMNFLSCSVFSLSCGIIYKFNRKFSGAIFGAVTAVVAVTSVMMLANLFITPYYMGVERSAVIAMIPTLLLPFNLCKCIINAAVTLIIYKPLTNGLKKAHRVESSGSTSVLSKKSAILTLVCLLILVAAILYILLKLGGQFKLF